MTAALAPANTLTPSPNSTPPTTLLDLVGELCAAGGTDLEVAVALNDLLETGRVRFIAHLQDEHWLAR